MFRIASIVLLASLCSLTTAQTDNTKNTAQTEPAANGTVSEAPATASNQDAQDADRDGITKEQASLEVNVLDAGLHATVRGTEAGFLGVFALSLTSNLASFNGLPPLLADAVVMGFGYTYTQELAFKVPLLMPPEAMYIHGQALIIDEHGFFASGIVPIVVGGEKGDTPAPAIH